MAWPTTSARGPGTYANGITPTPTRACEHRPRPPAVVVTRKAGAVQLDTRHVARITVGDEPLTEPGAVAKKRTRVGSARGAPRPQLPSRRRSVPARPEPRAKSPFPGGPHLHVARHPLTPGLHLHPEQADGAHPGGGSDRQAERPAPITATSSCSATPRGIQRDSRPMNDCIREHDTLNVLAVRGCRPRGGAGFDGCPEPQETSGRAECGNELDRQRCPWGR